MNNSDQLFAHLALASIGMLLVESFRKRKPHLKSDISDTLNKAWSERFRNRFSGLFIRKIDINFYRNKLTVRIETMDGLICTSSCLYTNIESKSIRPKFYHHRASATIHPTAPDLNGNTSVEAHVSGLTNFFVKNNPSDILNAITPAIDEGLENIRKRRDMGKSHST